MEIIISKGDIQGHYTIKITYGDNIQARALEEKKLDKEYIDNLFALYNDKAFSG